jgi:hypothetical protein
MANGILAREGKVYISATREGKVYEFSRSSDGTLADKTMVAEISGPDNLFWHEQSLLTASHTSSWKFFRHVSSQENLAPSYVVRIAPAKKELSDLYYNRGDEISAASGAFIHKGKLLVSQVFGDYLLECSPIQ